MEIETYDQNMVRLEKWHKKELSDDQGDMFFRLLNEISDVAFPEIVDRWIKHSKPLPGSFPTVNDLSELWKIWKAENHDLFEKKKRPECDQCHGRGWLWFKAPDPVTKMENEFIAGCASCFGFRVDTGTGRRVTVSTRAKLESKGYQVWPYKYENKRKFKSFDEVKKSIGNKEDIPF